MEKIHTDVRVQRVKTYCWGEGMCHCISTGPSPLHWMWSIFIPYRRLRKCRCCWNTESINIRGGLKCILLIGRDELKLVDTLIILSKSSPDIFTSRRLRRSIEILQSGIFSSLKYHENVFMINLVSVIFVKYNWFRTFEAGFVVIILSGFVTKSPRHLVTIT